MTDVKGARRYDSARRREQARQGRDQILDTARRLFLADGYGNTTMAAIAAACGVSVETVYKGFRNKPGLVRAIAERALAGTSTVPTMQRSDEMAHRQTNPHALVRGWAGFAAEVTPRFAPVVLLIKTAAAGSPEMADLLASLDADRMERMAHQARLLHERGFLRPDVTPDEARDVMWAYTDPAMYEMLVLRQSWPVERFRTFLADALTVALLDPPPTKPAC